MNGEDQRRALMRASVRHVPFDGWSEVRCGPAQKTSIYRWESPRPCFRRAAKTWWSCIAVRPTRRRSTPLQHEIWCQCACGNAWRQPSGRGLKSAPRTEKPFGGPCRCLRCPETPPSAPGCYTVRSIRFGGRPETGRRIGTSIQNVGCWLESMDRQFSFGCKITLKTSQRPGRSSIAGLRML